MKKRCSSASSSLHSASEKVGKLKPWKDISGEKIPIGAPDVLEFPRGIRVVNDAKIREQLYYAVTNQSELIGSITYIDEKVNMPGLYGPLKDLFDSSLKELLVELKSHQEMISVLTGWAAQAGLYHQHSSGATMPLNDPSTVSAGSTSNN